MEGGRVMGLDLILCKKIKNQDNYDMSIEEEFEFESELAYGRKTWAIADFFRVRCEAIAGDYLYKVKEEEWRDFIDSLERLYDPDFREKVELFCEYGIDWELDTDKEKHYWRVYNELESWLDAALGNDVGYQLGLEWELSAVLRWFDADKEVCQAYRDGYEIELIVSY